jgi:formate-dependent nitrite reductase cytochrome c552 subunit
MQGHKPWAKRQWFYGDWTCAQCGAKIDRLPFNPDPARVDQLLCKDCHRTKMQSFRK